MVILDYVILGIILVLGLLGFKKGFLESLGSVVGLILAAIIASRFYPVGAGWMGDSNFANITSFIVIFLITVKLVSLVFWVLGKIFQIITVLPFISSFDRLLGFILGLVEGILILAVILNFLLKYPLNEWMILQMGSSMIARVLLTIGGMFVPLFPEALKRIKSFM